MLDLEADCEVRVYITPLECSVPILSPVGLINIHEQAKAEFTGKKPVYWRQCLIKPLHLSCPGVLIENPVALEARGTQLAVISRVAPGEEL